MKTNKKFNKKYIIFEKNKIKKNKCIIKMIVENLENVGGGFCIVKFLQTYNYYNLKKGDIYAVKIWHVKKSQWKYN